MISATQLDILARQHHEAERHTARQPHHRAAQAGTSTKTRVKSEITTSRSLGFAPLIAVLAIAVMLFGLVATLARATTPPATKTSTMTYPTPGSFTGTLAYGAEWIIETPHHFNGTVLEKPPPGAPR